MKTVLMDRDGTLIVDPPDFRIDTPEEIKLFPDTIEALAYLAEHGFNIIMITNQAGIAEGLLDEKRFWELQDQVLATLAPSGIEVLKTYMSPHGQNEVNEWRKPGPGMLLKAAKDYNLDLAKTYMVGDRQSDIQAGINAGTKTILVKTGLVAVEVPEADYTAPNLLDVTHYIVEHAL